MNRSASIGLVIVLAASRAAAGTPAHLVPTSEVLAQALPSSPPLPPIPSTGGVPDTGADDPLPPYEPQLERLSEMLGTLTYLRSLCGKGDAAEWRKRMTILLDAEAKGESRRDRLAGAYNRGFRGYQATYHSCTPSADLVISRFLAESDRLARDLTTRFSGT